MQILKDCDADVICLQEVTPGFLDRLLHQGWVQRFYAASDIPSGDSLKFGKGEQYGVVILAKLHLQPKFCIWGLPTRFGRRLVTAQLSVTSSAYGVGLSHSSEVLVNSTTPHERAALTPVARSTQSQRANLGTMAAPPFASRVAALSPEAPEPSLSDQAVNTVTLPLVVGTVHLDSCEASTPTRMAQLQKIFPILLSLRELSGSACPLLLAGDFNIFHPETETTEIPTQFVDMWRFLSPHQAGITMAANHGYSSSRPDRILLSPACCSPNFDSPAAATPSHQGASAGFAAQQADMEPESMRIIGTESIPVAQGGLQTNITTPSDHYGLLASFALQPASQKFRTATQVRMCPPTYEEEQEECAEDEFPHRRRRPEAPPLRGPAQFKRQYSILNEAMVEAAVDQAAQCAPSPDTPSYGPTSPPDACMDGGLVGAAALPAYPSTPAQMRLQAVPASAAAAGIEMKAIYFKTPVAKREEYLCSAVGERGTAVSLPANGEGTGSLPGGALELNHDGDTQLDAPPLQPHARNLASGDCEHSGLNTSAMSHGSAGTELYDGSMGRSRLPISTVVSLPQPAFHTPTQAGSGALVFGSAAPSGPLSGMQSIVRGSSRRTRRLNPNTARSSPLTGPTAAQGPEPPAMATSPIGGFTSRLPAAAAACFNFVPIPPVPSRVVDSAHTTRTSIAVQAFRGTGQPSGIDVPPDVPRSRNNDPSPWTADCTPNASQPGTAPESRSGSGSSQEGLQGMRNGFNGLSITTGAAGSACSLVSSKSMSPDTLLGDRTPMQFDSNSLSFAFQGETSSALPTPRAGHEALHGNDSSDDEQEYAPQQTQPLGQTSGRRDVSLASTGIEVAPTGCRLLTADSIGDDDDTEFDEHGDETYRDMPSATPRALYASASSPAQSETSAGKRSRDAPFANQAASIPRALSSRHRNSSSHSALEGFFSAASGMQRSLALPRRLRARTSPMPHPEGASVSVGGSCSPEAMRASPVLHVLRRPATASPGTAAGHTMHATAFPSAGADYTSSLVARGAKLRFPEEEQAAISRNGDSTPGGMWVQPDGAELVQPSPNKMSKGARSEDCGSALGRDSAELPLSSALGSHRFGGQVLHPLAQPARGTNASGSTGPASRSKRTHSQSLEGPELLQGFDEGDTYEAADSVYGETVQLQPEQGSGHSRSGSLGPMAYATGQSAGSAHSARNRASTEGFTQQCSGLHMSAPGLPIVDACRAPPAPPAASAGASMSSWGGDSQLPLSSASMPSTGLHTTLAPRNDTPVNLARASALQHSSSGLPAQPSTPLRQTLHPNTAHIPTSGMTPARKQARQ